ncbi:MAG TPA: amidinotransferase [Flavobacteriales bacterium]|nr:amidinotransferase [Flavobacteriales bacterium]HRE74662.1 arginine deiminase-related protein [Flavobacteriales bacterium]HRJ35983.1 arginine deiminase-related protein [Flavobacteriales bacterium]HRJ39462.1 arginine deiminase-related protein [Flavobacteriales bacterium]
MHSPQTVFLVRPDHFGFNAETAQSNAFQKNDQSANAELAKEEFNTVIELLRREGIDHLVFPSREDVTTPDAVFPNNWISILPDGTLILYPMMAVNRRLERNMAIVQELHQKFPVQTIIDLSEAEQSGHFLEGTGSIVFDHTHKIAYACISPRTDEKLLNELSKRIGYRAFAFEAIGPKSEQIYHTNVVMSVAENYAIVCLDAVPDTIQAQMLKSSLELTGKSVIPISFAQMNQFAGNMLEVRDKNGKAVLLMSSTAFHSLDTGQITEIEKHVRIAHIAIPTIETLGGGSLRCMLAGIQIPRKGE